MKRLPFVLLVLTLLAFPSTVFADIAPPYNPPGTNPQPGSESTQVRMAAETVLIDVKNESDLGSARITADFTMRNMGGESESMAVRFPISADNGRGEYPELKNLVIKVGGKPITYRRVNYPDIRYQLNEVPWAEFDVTFPAGQEIPLQVAYDLFGSGYWPNTAFYYILQTGAGWNDTIGSADVILRLPYAANTQNVIVGMQIGWAETTPGGEFQGNEVRWHFEDFEPGFEGPVADMEFALVSPEIWTSILKERGALAGNAGDGEAWGRLAKAYKEIYFLSKGYRIDAGGEELYQLSIEAYEKCLSIKPGDAQWHAGFADLLIGRSYWDSWGSSPTSDAFRALEEIQIALELAPNDPVVLEIAQNMQSMFPNGMTVADGGYDFPWLTQTPTPLPATPTIVPAYDPNAISGTYQSDMLTFSNNKNAQLTISLSSNYSAEMETKYEVGQAIVLNGSWLDNGDGTLRLSVIDENGKRIEFIFNVEDEGLQAIQYPSIYGDAGIELKKIDSTLPTPGPNPGDSTPASQSPSPLCGSAALAPLIAIIWMKRKHERENSL